MFAPILKGGFGSGRKPSKPKMMCYSDEPQKTTEDVVDAYKRNPDKLKDLLAAQEPHNYVRNK